ncbi:DUF3612 domain-containing protein [Motilimonas pumila]|uniref:DUF3612 domain-containing protein n=1 Tax=Motilimonas pumila TaxID=2303987 RepID=A0A418YFM6_9GAMM|nr:DUF3612 domain-containing protein [Motilimonas pumila]RJG48196.1 DUF3612 domain-containing protein [Motilimonas pumila]
MKPTASLIRQSHFLGTKVRNARKQARLTLEDLSARCIKVDAQHAPSVSYLSMIERGKRVPSEAMLQVVAQVFQKPYAWFLDDTPEVQAVVPEKGNRGGILGMALEPSFLFSKDILQIALPELLAQTGTSGKEFAHLLIRAYQEHHQNHFPDLERAAESLGHKRMPLSVNDLLELCHQAGLTVHWFDRPPESLGEQGQRLISSFFEPPATLYINQQIKANRPRLKYDLAVHLGHSILHNNDGVKSVMVAGSGHNVSVHSDNQVQQNIEAQNILNAWRDFECSFFAGALLCPKVPFRQLLDQHGYEIDIADILEVSPAVVMRRMTAVSPYPHWHYFDAYGPGQLKAVYRGNGIPLPWGNMRTVQDPCEHWAVFRKLQQQESLGQGETSAQISILQRDASPRLYCCESIRVQDQARNQHVLCAGIDLNPVLDEQGYDSHAMVSELQQLCQQHGGSAIIPGPMREVLNRISKLLNINWLARGIESPARLICTRGANCLRQPACQTACHTDAESNISVDIEAIQRSIITASQE